MITGRLTKKGFEITRFIPTVEKSALEKFVVSLSNKDKGRK